MGDFLIDFRPAPERRAQRAASLLKFFDDIQVTLLEHNRFALVLTSPDEARLWAPAWDPESPVSVALCGRVALEQKEWEQAASLPGTGGLACRSLAHRYREDGLEGIAEVSGNFVILILDQPAQEFHLVTDRWGLMPAFKYVSDASIVMASHPDALAEVVGETNQLDLISLAEFVLTCRLSAPFTYYTRIRALPIGSVTTIDLRSGLAIVKSTRAYYQPRENPDSDLDSTELAHNFVSAFKRSVAKRTLPILGKTAVALSGGLDSRAVLCARSSDADVIAFSCYDAENEEFRIAKAIASAAGVRFRPMPRSSDYYLETAALGVKISGGMGCFASNHFLGCREELIRLGVRNLLTGCYCDYLFKGLAFNKRVNPWTRTESPGKFNWAYYSHHFRTDTLLGRAVTERLEQLFPLSLRRYQSESEFAEVERRRLFPLAYEEDNAERIIPQRVMGWFVPVAENELLRLSHRMPSRMKLNRKLFSLAAREICGPEISSIPNANTGLPMTAGPIAEICQSHLQCAGKLLSRLGRSRSTNGSWLNWQQYMSNGRRFRALWEKPDSEAESLFRQILGNQFSWKIEEYQGKRLALLLQLFTLKIWLEHRSRPISLPVSGEWAFAK